jgi:hypothetical protein
MNVSLGHIDYETASALAKRRKLAIDEYLSYLIRFEASLEVMQLRRENEKLKHVTHSHTDQSAS